MDYQEDDYCGVEEYGDQSLDIGQLYILQQEYYYFESSINRKNSICLFKDTWLIYLGTESKTSYRSLFLTSKGLVTGTSRGKEYWLGYSVFKEPIAVL